MYVLTVGDVEDLSELESVGGVGSVACTEVILVVFCKQGETLCHAPLVKSIDVEHDGESLLHIELETSRENWATGTMPAALLILFAECLVV